MEELLEIEFTSYQHNGTVYTLTKLDKPYDMTEENNGIHTLVLHELNGFEQPLLVIYEDHGEVGISFTFGVRIGETGLVVSLQDEKIMEEAVEVLFHMLGYDE